VRSPSTEIYATLGLLIAAIELKHNGASKADSESQGTSKESLHTYPIGMVRNATSGVIESRSLTWDQLTKMLSLTVPGKKDGPGWVPANIPVGPRNGESVESVTLLVLDVEAKTVTDIETKEKTIIGPEPPSFDEILDAITAYKWHCFLHTSYTHTVEHPRYRLIFDIDRSLTADEVRPLGLYVAELLDLTPCLDTNALEPARLFYKPRCAPGNAGFFRYANVEGSPLCVSHMLESAKYFREAARSPKSALKGRAKTIVDAFNLATPIGSVLEAHGYIPKGSGRWIHPKSTTGTPGVRLMPKRTPKDPDSVFSHHGDCDPLADGKPHDAFDIYRIFEHNHDLKAALAGVVELLDLPDKEGRETQGGRLLEIAESAEFFRTADSQVFADVRICNGADAAHRETWEVSSKEFRYWLTRGYHAETDRGVSLDALRSTVNVLKALGLHDTALDKVHLRTGASKSGKEIYIDLCNETWQAVEVTASGWNVIDEPPIHFRRADGALPLPVPHRGGRVDELRGFLNISDDDFVLAIAWILAALRGYGPLPVAVCTGEQGSTKSTCAKLMRLLIDPTGGPLQPRPTDERDLFISAHNRYVLAFDNVSYFSQTMSDALCCMATGGGYATRKLYTDSEEVVFDVKRPVILNGIEDSVLRPDLADRCLFLELNPVPDDKRRTEDELEAAFEEAKPRILGRLLDIMAYGIGRLPETKLSTISRMADFETWITACEPAFTTPGTFKRVYMANRDSAVRTLLDGSLVATVLRSYITVAGQWEGTGQALLDTLTCRCATPSGKSWPGNARALSGHLRRLAPGLRKVGVDVDFGRTSVARLIKIVPFEIDGGDPVSEASRQKNRAPDFVLQDAR